MAYLNGTNILFAAGATGLVDFDDTPTAASDKPVTSDGIKSYVDAAAVHDADVSAHTALFAQKEDKKSWKKLRTVTIVEAATDTVGEEDVTAFTLTQTPVVASTVQTEFTVGDEAKSVTDTGTGQLVLADETVVGTVDYQTGTVSVTAEGYTLAAGETVTYCYGAVEGELTANSLLTRRYETDEEGNDFSCDEIILFSEVPKVNEQVNLSLRIRSTVGTYPSGYTTFNNAASTTAKSYLRVKWMRECGHWHCSGVTNANASYAYAVRESYGGDACDYPCTGFQIAFSKPMPAGTVIEVWGK